MAQPVPPKCNLRDDILPIGYCTAAGRYFQVVEWHQGELITDSCFRGRCRLPVTIVDTWHFGDASWALSTCRQPLDGYTSCISQLDNRPK